MMLYFKVEVYDDEGARQCLNVLCNKCRLETIQDGYKLIATEYKENTIDKIYWCDNCLVGSDHELWQEAFNKSIKKKYG